MVKIEYDTEDSYMKNYDKKAKSNASGKKAYVLNPGDTVAIRARGVNWGWTINDYKHCSFRAVDDLSWFHTINYDYYPATWFDDDSDDNLFYKLTDKQFKPLKKILNTCQTSGIRSGENIILI